VFFQSKWGDDGTSLSEVFASTTSATDDARYSKGIAVADGRVRTATAGGNNPITTAEINLPPFLYNGRRDTILALTTREDPNFTVPIGGTHEHRTSDIAEASIGDSLVILDGPNAGDYTIQDLRVLDMWSKSGLDGHRKIALVQLDQELLTDPLKTVIDYINDAGVASAITADELAAGIEDATNFFDSTFWTSTLVARLRDTINDASQLGAGTITTEETEDLLLKLAASGYEIGPSAEGTLRVYFQEPVSVEFSFGASPTIFQVVGQPEQRFRISPELDPAQIFPQAIELQDPSEWNRNLTLGISPRTTGFLTSGTPFVLRGIEDGDTIEWRPPINDYPARKDMKSSWLFVTQAGSNIVRAIFSGPTPASETPDNETNIEEGHLFFIDSGPDVGAYVVTEVLDTDFTADPPLIKFKVDRGLTHSTDVYPATTDRDFKSHPKAVVSSEDNTFPMTFSGGETLDVDFESSPSGILSRTFTFTSKTYNNVGELVTDINADGAFVGSEFEAFEDGDKLVLRSLLSSTPLEKLTVKGTSTAIGGSLLQFSSGQIDGGRLGAVAVKDSKKIYGSGLSTGVFSIDDYISLYASHEAGVAASDDAILTSGDDEAFLGTFQVTSVGTETDGPRTGEEFLELNRSQNFPSTAEVRWIRHSEPETSPSNTSGGGKQLAQNYIRGRMYSEVSEKATVTIPWLSASEPDGSDNPVEETSEIQIEISEDPIGTGANYGHRMPYRILRDDIFKVSSTIMESQREGALYFVDVPVLGIGTREELNIDTETALQLEGNFKIDGYTLEVENEIFTFSEDEQVSIILPASVLPPGSTPDIANRISLGGQNLQVNYDNAALIASIQQFFDSPLDRVTVANILVRHFLPTYVIIDASYTGGALESEVAQAIIDHINSIDPNVNELTSDDISRIIRQKGASQVQQPIKLIALTHGIDRRIRGTQSLDAIGGLDLPNFQGTFKQSYFIPGPDTSDEDTRPNGEQIFLDRL